MTTPGKITIDQDITYEVNVQPIGFEGLRPKYEVSIYIWRKHGVCGPGAETTIVGLDQIDTWLRSIGYLRLSAFGPVCTNGYASAPIRPTKY